ncbi:MAG: hypothetical protein ABI680_04795, partial [Chthoniobacteraceae bacterium]
DHRADVYGVGLMLYEMLCREIPLGAFEPPSQRIGCDTRIDKIVLKAMQQAPDRRYQSTLEMRTDVASALAPAITVPLRRFVPPPQLAKVVPPRRGLPVIPMTFVIVAAIIGGLIYKKLNPSGEFVAVSEGTERVPAVAPASPPAETPQPAPNESAGIPAPKPEDVAAAAVAPAPPAPAPLSETAKWIAEYVPQWQAAYAAEVSEPFEKGVAGLREQYLATVERQLAASGKPAKFAAVAAFRAELDRMAGGGDVPAEEEATTPPALKTLRARYRIAFAKLDTERVAKAKSVHARYDAILQQSQIALTQRERLDEALEMKAQREALSAAWLTPPADTAAAPATIDTTNPAATTPSRVGATARKSPRASDYTQHWQSALHTAGVDAKSFKQLPGGTWDVNLAFAKIGDVNILSGVPISRLRLGYIEVSDLSPLHGMPLKLLDLDNTQDQRSESAPRHAHRELVSQGNPRDRPLRPARDAAHRIEAPRLP